MKSLKEYFESICQTLEVEYKESRGAKMGITWGKEVVTVNDLWCCEIWKDGEKIHEGYASPTTNEGITETTKETAREWLLYSLISKAL